MLRAYYETMKSIPLSQEEKKKFLQPEILSKLTTEEYISLWRRLNPYFLSHVTRQGFRDHNAMIYHSAGLQEFHQGFTSILDDQKIIRPPIALGDGLIMRDDASIKKYIERVFKADTEGEAKELLQQMLHFTWASAPQYPDITAVHFAAQMVLDDYYGGEKGNEIFFIYPSDVVASQNNYAFNGWEKDFTIPQSEKKWNDIFVWPSTLENP